MQKLLKASSLAVSLFSFFICSSAFAGATNDFFSHGTLITRTNVVVLGNNSGGSMEAGENTGDTNVNYLYSVWYTWTAPTKGVLYLSGSNSITNFLMDIRAYTGTDISNLIPVITNSDGGTPVMPDETVAIRVASVYYPASGLGGGAGSFQLALSMLAPLPVSSNDAFTNRAVITAPDYHFEGGIYGATTEPGEPLPSPSTTETLWWAFSPTNSGALELDFSTDYFTPVQAVYEGTLFGLMTPLTPLSSGKFYLLQAGHDYSVQLSSAYILAGNFSMDAHFYDLSNDFFAGATQLAGTNIVYQGNFTAATAETGEPASGATNTVWASWTAPSNGIVAFSLATTPQSQYVSVYQGSTLATLQPVSLNSPGNFTATSGTTYYFQFSGGGDDFTFNLTETRVPPPNNDNFADATAVLGRNVFENGSITTATMEIGEPQPLGAGPQKSVWWKWVAPNYGSAQVSSYNSQDSRAIIAAYSGSSFDRLKLLTIGSNSTTMVSFPIKGGETYYFAGVAPADASGNIALNVTTFINSSVHIVPGNLLLDPSWEGTHLNSNHWQFDWPVSGYTDQPGGVDGTTWPVVGGGHSIWQDISVQPGHTYAVKFAYLVGGIGTGCCGYAQVGVYYDNNRIGTGHIPEAESGFWHWSNFSFTPTNTTARILFKMEGRNLEMDAFSVADISVPPFITTQPISTSVVNGGTANFNVGVAGPDPLNYQWFFKGSPLSGATDNLLVFNSATTNQAGDYYLTASNSFGAVTSATVSLYVENPLSPVIVWQPYSGLQPAGSYFTFSVAAIGQPPFTYQWFTNGVAIPSATNQTLIFGSLSTTNAGTYTVVVQNSFGSVMSLPTTLTISTTNTGGGMINSYTQSPVNALVFDIDGVTRIGAGSCLAQLYAGPSLELLRPAGPPQQFYSFPPPFVGYVRPAAVTLPNVPGKAMALAQLRVWDSSKGNSYEEARALGGKFGASDIISVLTGGYVPGNPTPLAPATLFGIHNFTLHSGLPRFESAQLNFVKLQDDGSTVWTLTGEPNYRYLIEQNIGNNAWQPYSIVTNVTGIVTFTNASIQTNTAVFYRSRILD